MKFATFSLVFIFLYSFQASSITRDLKDIKELKKAEAKAASQSAIACIKASMGPKNPVKDLSDPGLKTNCDNAGIYVDHYLVDGYALEGDKIHLSDAVEHTSTGLFTNSNPFSKTNNPSASGKTEK